MADVIDLSARGAKEKKKLKARSERRAQAVAAALACGVCPRRCIHCGLPVEEPSAPLPEAPYNFCQPCKEELSAYLRRQKGQGGGQMEPEAFWHTDEWAETWRTWLENMKARQAFRSSTAFLKLMNEYQD